MKINVTAPFCAYIRTYPDGRQIRGHGKFASAFNVSPDDPEFSVEILGMFWSLRTANKAAKEGVLKNGVIVHPTGKIYRDIADASVATGVAETTITAHLYGRSGYDAPRGFTFQRFPKEAITGMGMFSDPKADRRAREREDADLARRNQVSPERLRELGYSPRKKPGQPS